MMDRHSPELEKIVEALTNRIVMNGQPVTISVVNYGALEQIFDGYAAVKIRRLAEYPQLSEVAQQLRAFADAVQAGMV